MTQRFHFQDGIGQAFALPAAPARTSDTYVTVNYYDQVAEPATEAMCGEQADSGRVRFAARPEQNHYGAGEFKDVQHPDPASERTEAEWRDPRTAPSGETPSHRGMYSPPSANTNTHAGRLGVSVVAGPRTDRPDIGFSGAALAPGEYDPRTNLSTVQPRGETLGNNTASGVAGFKRQGGMAGPPVLETADAQRLRSINDRNKRFWQGSRDADPQTATPPGEIPDRNPEDDEPQVTRHTLTKQGPDGALHVQRWEREVHPAAPVPTADTRLRRPQLPRLASDGGRFGLMAAGRAAANREAAGVSIAALVNARNRAFWR